MYLLILQCNYSSQIKGCECVACTAEANDKRHHPDLQEVWSPHTCTVSCHRSNILRCQRGYFRLVRTSFPNGSIMQTVPSDIVSSLAVSFELRPTVPRPVAMLTYHVSSARATRSSKCALTAEASTFSAPRYGVRSKSCVGPVNIRLLSTVSGCVFEENGEGAVVPDHN